ncbi:GxxExxY protein [Jiulongibacter sediminis]|uniref:GxxExxY protein n=1 Tax=Jiulongibacter sediminis TaxID=1605367 RepID=UPI0026F0442C|nr:GxxExxY protein [Jiulongibacter sediminis]
MDINDLTHKIIGASMQVHRVLGNGFQEVIYQRALAVEFNHIGISYEREKEMNIFYRDEQVGTRRVDFFVEEAVMVELKAVSELEEAHKAQAINYLEAYGIANGLLINFGKTSLEFKRVYNKKLVNPANPINHKTPVQDNI